MGADFILAVAPMPPGEGTVEEWMQAYYDAIDSLDDQVALDIYEEMFGDPPDEIHDDNPSRTQRWLVPEIARRVFREAVPLIKEDRRDCGLYKVGDRWALMTGGMSWGDNPSDSWQDVQILSNVWWVTHGE